MAIGTEVLQWRAYCGSQASAVLYFNAVNDGLRFSLRASVLALRVAVLEIALSSLSEVPLTTTSG